ncbi:hypothetical protein GC207_10740 [bacterium]|nr:hypothetical protein [bacterium]
MNPTFPCGIVEGFYGQPWTFPQRHKVLRWLSQFGLNTYVYGPKDDLKHRVIWRDLLDDTEADEFKKLIHACREHGIRFVYAIAPGWDDLFGGNDWSASDKRPLLDGLKNRFQQLLDLGCHDFAVMFDDIPNLPPDELAEIGKRHAETGNEIWQWLQTSPGSSRRKEAPSQTETPQKIGASSRRLLPECEAPCGSLAICPSVYCTRMAGNAPSDSSYLRALGETLDQRIDIYWTGPEIISPKITAEHLRAVTEVLRRPPLIWDNLHANDYDCARIYLGPFSDRTSALPQLTRGLVINPNRQCELNFLPLATLGDFVRSGADYSPNSARQKAIKMWLPEWNRVTGPAFAAQTIALIVDCFHLPFANGPKANELMHQVHAALQGSPNEISQALKSVKTTGDVLGKFFFELSALKNRDLFEALWPHVWRLKDELSLVIAIGEQRLNGVEPPFIAPDYAAGVFRGGLLGELRELIQPASGGFRV